MVVKYKVSGVIEIDLDKEEIKEFQTQQSETMKKEYLNELLHNRLRGCETTLEGELSQNINFDELYVESDWDRYAGNMKSKNELYGSPLGISIEGISTTPYEEYENAMYEIGKRKRNKKH